MNWKQRYKELLSNGQSGSMSLEINQSVLNFFKDIEKHIPKAHYNTIIDFGCGSGKMCEFLVKHFSADKYIGYDIVDSIISYCREKFDYEFHVKDTISEKCDLIWCSFLLQHIQELECIDLLGNFEKYLNKDGVMYITVCTDEGTDTVSMYYRGAGKYKALFTLAGLRSSVAFNTMVGNSQVTCFEVKA